MKSNYSLKNTIRIGLASGLAAMTVGCANMGARPYISAEYNTGNPTGRAGIEIGSKSKDNLFTIVTSPVRPNQWKTHPIRTSLMTGVYVGIGVAAASAGGSGGGSSSSEVVEKTEDTSGSSGDNYEAPTESAPAAPYVPPSSGSGQDDGGAY